MCLMLLDMWLIFSGYVANASGYVFNISGYTFNICLATV